jgi:hypothetical protein
MNKRKPIAVIDVDLTVVDSVEGPDGWLSWLNAKTGLNLTAEDCGYQYNLAKIFQPHWPAHCTETPMSWWRYPGIYDKLQPIRGSVEALERISRTHDVVFVSHCKGSHMKSKVSFLKKHFGHIMSGFVATKEKWVVSSGNPLDLVVDDRNEHLANFKNTDHTLIKFNTNWSQFVELTDVQVTIFQSWESIADWVVNNNK